MYLCCVHTFFTQQPGNACHPWGPVHLAWWPSAHLPAPSLAPLSPGTIPGVPSPCLIPLPSAAPLIQGSPEEGLQALPCRPPSCQGCLPTNPIDTCSLSQTGGKEALATGLCNSAVKEAHVCTGQRVSGTPCPSVEATQPPHPCPLLRCPAGALLLL